MSSNWQLPGLQFMGIGLELVASVAVFTAFGWWVDRRFDTAPWGVLIGAGLGLVGGMYSMVRSALAATRSPRGDAGPAQDDDEGTTER